MSTIPIGDDARDDRRAKVSCPVCGDDFEPVGRSRNCSQRCRQRAYWLRRHQAQQVTLADRASTALRRQRQLVAQTVYACPACEERYLGERRCPLCRHRHNGHHADLAFMPSWPVVRVGAAA